MSGDRLVTAGRSAEGTYGRPKRNGYSNQRFTLTYNKKIQDCKVEVGNISL